ncbi:MAG: type II and III secretion system protein family protein [Sphingomonas sp.]|nr:type II and III secretion system protein family protein [Sphingomonas sp.]
MGGNLFSSLRALRRASAAGAILAIAFAAQPALAQVTLAEGVHAGELDVPVNKSQVLRADRPYAKALIGSPEIADVLPLSDTSVYVLGKKAGTTSLTLYDRSNHLIAVVDVVVGPDVMTLKHQLADLIPGDDISARVSNDSIVLEGVVPGSVDADRAVQLADTYAPGKVVNMLSIGSSQQVMLEVRFSEVKRSALQQLGFRYGGNNGSNFAGVIGNGSGLQPGSGDSSNPATPFGNGRLTLGTIADTAAVLTRKFGIGGLNFWAAFDALETKGDVNTLAEPTLTALSGETASFLAGGEFPVPVVQNGGGGGGGAGAGGNGSSAISVEWKPFGVSLSFTPTVLADGVINLVVAPEVSSIDPSASITINNLTIPGLQTRRAKTVVELRDGESFALAGLLRKDFQDTIREVPLLGKLPIIGTLFRSTGFQHQETELVIIVTPRLVRPVRAGTLRVPTDRVLPPNEADLLLNGRQDSAMPPSGVEIAAPPPPPPAYVAPPPPPPPPAGGMAQAKPSGFEKDYGHVL